MKTEPLVTRDSFWDAASDAVCYMDCIDLLDGVVGGFRYAHWRRAWQRRGALGIALEFFATLFERNSVEIRFARGTPWRGIDVERLLYRYHIPIWGRWLARNELMLRVKKSQARFAEYILLRCGVTLTRSRYYPNFVAAPRPERNAMKSKDAPRVWTRRFWRSGNLLDRALQLIGLG